MAPEAHSRRSASSGVKLSSSLAAGVTAFRSSRKAARAALAATALSSAAATASAASVRWASAAATFGRGQRQRSSLDEGVERLRRVGQLVG